MADTDIPSAEGREPVFDQKVRGIVEQTKGDLALGGGKTAREVLERRLKDTGLDLDAAQLDELVKEIEG